MNATQKLQIEQSRFAGLVQTVRKAPELAQNILDALVRLQDPNAERHESIGICGNIDLSDTSISFGFLKNRHNIVAKTILSVLPGDNNNFQYPIEDDPAVYHFEENKWDITEEFGQKRWRLLDDMVATLQHAIRKAAMAHRSV